MKVFSRRQFLRRWALSSSALILTACNQALDDNGAETQPTSSPPIATAQSTVELVTEMPAASPTATVRVPSPSPSLAPTQTPPAEPAPTGALTFRPTDPAAVELVAGKPQFVEFFAFW